ncbi:type VI secretion system Vgr family protein [Ralstonia wenshanensis]|uniref:Type VI secretion system tip protein VgrG n=1 Tax=Ralstonia wenshanensis TaxID=2842456 RepID=A0AAD2AXW7_9RALS|nr:type VI secretion system tip protein TssI/VgrG [Ralstonia wenshanensis]CAJ0692083.1 hypothetical protein LMG18091_01554 [Ralstonia wenshanensis]
MGNRLALLNTRTVSVTGHGLPEILGKPALVFSKLSGTERLCELFEYEIELKTPDERNVLYGPAANLDTNALRGQELTVTIALDGTDAGTRQISGLVTDIVGPTPVNGGRQLKYRLTLRPWLWLATLNRDTRIFQQQTVVEILDALLGGYIFPVERRLDIARYPRRDYQVQYNESDFEFFQRLTQEWGIAWHIEHSGGKHRLVLTDGNGAFGPFASPAYQTIRWQPSSDRIDEEHLHTFELHDKVVSGQWAATDYDFVKPSADLTVRAADPLDTAHANAEVREWPGDHSQPTTGNDPWKEGDQIARMRMEALRQHGRRARGAGNVRAMVPGCTFTLTHFVQSDANREYLTLGAQLLIEDVPESSGGNPAWRCEVSFTAQPSNELFRPERTQPKPRTTGPQTATVVGPENQEVWSDEYGRVKVQFHWDRIGQRNANSSCWVRTSSPWQGERFGAIQIPRIGQEVIVDFLNGDPDCPIITGRVPNRHNMPQWPMPGHHALSGFVSKELHGGRTNTFVQDDTQGQIQTQLQSDHQNSSLSLGYITRVLRGTGRQDKRGEGLEARTDGHAAVRAALGLLLTTLRRPEAEGGMMSVEDVIAFVQEALTLADSLGQSAVNGQAQTGEQQDVAKVLHRQAGAIKGGGKLAEFSEPHITVASQAGILTSAPGTTHIASGEHIALTSGQHLSFSSGGGMYATATERFSLFVQRDGIKLFSAKGKLEMQAQSDAMDLLAQKVLRILSTTDWVEISGKKGIRLNVGGNEIRITPEGIENLSQGTWAVYSAGKLLTGPKTAAYAMPTSKICAHLAAGAATNGAGAVPIQ